MRLAVRWLFAVLLFAFVPAHAADVTVFAAASLSDALQEIGKAYQQKTGHTAGFSFAASSVLARQIESSPGADIFVSADSDWMDYLDKKGLIDRSSRKDLLGNALVLIAPATSKVSSASMPRDTVIAGLGNGRLAIADPGSVPAGKYGKAALTALGAWDAVSDHLASAENVRVALAYVARGEAPLGIVYATDAKAEPRVKIVLVFAENTHPPILYPAALTKDAKPVAKEFLAFLSGSEARAIFEKDGFRVLSKP
jgi:molybdate transport system substrate-binding protein